MEKHNGNRGNERVKCTLVAECIKLSGRSDVFCARSKNCSPGGLNLVAPKAVHPGTCLVVRIKNISAVDGKGRGGTLTETGLAEVRWVEEVMDTEGLAYAMGLKYLFTD